MRLGSDPGDAAFRGQTPRHALSRADPGWSGALDIGFSGRRSRHTVTLGLALDNGDDAVEEYSGFRIGLRSRRLGTRSFGARIEVSLLRQTWRHATLAALAADPPSPTGRAS